VHKGTRWPLLKNPENFDEEKREKRRLRDPRTGAERAVGGGLLLQARPATVLAAADEAARHEFEDAPIAVEMRGGSPV
jgi:hypothetical protein